MCCTVAKGGISGSLLFHPALLENTLLCLPTNIAPTAWCSMHSSVEFGAHCEAAVSLTYGRSVLGQQAAEAAEAVVLTAVAATSGGGSSTLA